MRAAAGHDLVLSFARDDALAQAGPLDGRARLSLSARRP
jgi:hypothetical protein